MKKNFLLTLIFLCLTTINSITISSNLENGRIIRRKAKNTITPVLLNKGDKLEFTLKNGQIRILQLLETNASIMRTNVRDFYEVYDLQPDGGTISEFSCKVLIDGHEMTMQRYLPTQESFYEPYVVNGMRIWFDATKTYFDHFNLKHGWCEPRADARFAVSDATDPVAPDLAAWFPIKEPFHNIKDSYLGDDPWMGPYFGVEPHGGMDINTPRSVPLYTPFDITEKDDQWLSTDFAPKPYYFAAYWTAIKNWPNGSEWKFSIAHLDNYLVDEHIPLKKGTKIAEAAGTGVGAAEHSHFVLWIRDEATNTVDDKVMLWANIINKLDSTYEIVDVDGKKGIVPKETALYIRRDDRPAQFSVFMMSESLAKKYGFKYEIPQIPVDPWYMLWQMFENYKEEKEWIKSSFLPVNPAKTGEAITFNSEGSRPGFKRNTLNYYWTFGDGGFSTVKNPKHIFAAPGVYPVTLVIDDGENKATYTQHITVDGKKITKPLLALYANESNFNIRKDFVQDVYGATITNIPHSLTFGARKSNLQPEAKIVDVINNGGGTLRDVNISIHYMDGSDWLSVTKFKDKNKQQLSVKVNAANLSPGTYKAFVNVTSDNAVNSNQCFIVDLDVIFNASENNVIIIDNESKEFYATPYFWVGSRLKNWVDGYRDFYLTNGGRNNPGEYALFTPELKKGNYNLSFVNETPFPESKIKVLVHHAHGDTVLTIKPHKSRNIGEFTFNEGKEGFVKILAEDSEGEVLVDAIKFTKVTISKNIKND